MIVTWSVTWSVIGNGTVILNVIVSVTFFSLGKESDCENESGGVFWEFWNETGISVDGETWNEIANGEEIWNETLILICLVELRAL